MQHPGEVTRKWRKQAKISLGVLAERTGIDSGTISRFERGGDFKWRVFEGICQGLGRRVVDAYAVLAEKAGASAEAPGAYVCRDPAHAPLHQYLDEILATQDRLTQIGIVANIVGMRERATRQPTDLPSALEEEYFGSLPPPSIKVIPKK